MKLKTSDYLASYCVHCMPKLSGSKGMPHEHFE